MDSSLIRARLEKSEGRIPYMYRCTGGKVTIGIGHALETPEDAANLTWNIAGDVGAGYARVASEPIGHAAPHYEPLSQCRMSDDAIDALATADIERFSGQLSAALPNWNSYPSCVQDALFDMAFNLGVGGLLKFHQLLAACDAADWETAANQCHRQGIGEPRNQETAALFRQALA